MKAFFGDGEPQCDFKKQNNLTELSDVNNKWESCVKKTVEDLQGGSTTVVETIENKRSNLSGQEDGEKK